MTFKRGMNPNSRNGFKKGHKPYRTWLGKTFSKEHRKKLSESVKQHSTPYWLGKKRPAWSREHNIKVSIALKGDKSSSWKGGITPINKAIRSSFEYREWRKSVFQRDNFTCVLCGQRGGQLNADHIKPFAYFPELRLELSNGRTLCVDCHRKTDTFGFNKMYL